MGHAVKLSTLSWMQTHSSSQVTYPATHPRGSTPSSSLSGHPALAHQPTDQLIKTNPTIVRPLSSSVMETISPQAYRSSCPQACRTEIQAISPLLLPTDQPISLPTSQGQIHPSIAILRLVVHSLSLLFNPLDIPTRSPVRVVAVESSTSLMRSKGTQTRIKIRLALAAQPENKVHSPAYPQEAQATERSIKPSIKEMGLQTINLATAAISLLSTDQAISLLITTIRPSMDLHQTVTLLSPDHRPTATPPRQRTFGPRRALESVWPIIPEVLHRIRTTTRLSTRMEAHPSTRIATLPSTRMVARPSTRMATTLPSTDKATSPSTRMPVSRRRNSTIRSLTTTKVTAQILVATTISRSLVRLRIVDLSAAQMVALTVALMEGLTAAHTEVQDHTLTEDQDHTLTEDQDHTLTEAHMETQMEAPTVDLTATLEHMGTQVEGHTVHHTVAQMVTLIATEARMVPHMEARMGRHTVALMEGQTVLLTEARQSTHTTIPQTDPQTVPHTVVHTEAHLTIHITML